MVQSSKCRQCRRLGSRVARALQVAGGSMRMSRGNAGHGACPTQCHYWNGTRIRLCCSPYIACPEARCRKRQSLKLLPPALQRVKGTGQRVGGQSSNSHDKSPSKRNEHVAAGNISPCRHCTDKCRVGIQMPALEKKVRWCLLMPAVLCGSSPLPSLQFQKSHRAAPRLPGNRGFQATTQWHVLCAAAA